MYQILTDSACDLPQAQLEALHIPYAPQSLGRTQEGAETTSAANPAAWQSLMTPILEAGKDVLALCLSSGVSATYQNAAAAAEVLRSRFPQRKIAVIDSRSASLGLGSLVTQAVQKQAQGLSLEDLTAWLEAQKHKIAHYFTVEDLAPLRRSGRISAATAIASTMLNAKPILTVDQNGCVAAAAKVRGRSVALQYLAQKFADTCSDKQTAHISHTGCPQDAETLAQLLQAQGAKNITITPASEAIQTHTGPTALALFFTA